VSAATFAAAQQAVARERPPWPPRELRQCQQLIRELMADPYDPDDWRDMVEDR
jgi:hypothetical protein